MRPALSPRRLASPSRACVFAAAALLAAIALAGCQDFLNAVFDSAAPTGVSASDGDYPDEIRVSWGSPSLKNEKWKDYSIAGYRVSWSGPDSGSDTAPGTSYTISVWPANRAQKYTVTVETRLSGGPIVSGGSASDDGFAMDAQELLWYDGGADHAIPGADQWYVTMLQKGFTYDFAFPVGESGTVEFCPYKSLDRVATISGAGSIQSWTCDSSGAGNKFYVRVIPDSPPTSFHASYGF